MQAQAHSTTTVEVGEIVVNPRVLEVVEPLIDKIGDHLRATDVRYDEWHAAVNFLVQVAKTGELPLLLDAFFEYIVDDNTNNGAAGTASAVEGPYYVPDSPMLANPGTMPQRPDEAGDTLVFCGRVVSTDGTPIGGALVDLWHADATVPGTYSNVHEGQPEYNLRGRLVADSDGRFEVRTIMPAPYPIPDQGPTGRLFHMLGRHSWRPAHIHAKVSAEGYRPLTTQVYFAGGHFLDSDCVKSVKDELIEPLEVTTEDGDTRSVLRHDFMLAPQNA